MPDTFSDSVLHWFDKHGRKELPWQQQAESYRIWISEIMLQQTRVQTVIPYFERFMQRFPDVLSVANAAQDEVLHHWSGLGYYARARNLHKAAIQIRDQYDGKFPDRLEALEQLPGIGRSTAGAILSLALNQRHAILDGNVKRVLARVHLVEGWSGQSAVLKTLWKWAETHTPESRVANYNQAMMDLGATLCSRSKPECHRCPLQTTCGAYAQNRQSELPAPKPRKDLPVRPVAMLLLVNQDRQEVLLQRRPTTGIWGGLWSFPEYTDMTAMESWCDQNQVNIESGLEPWPVVRHTFSHFHMDITPCRVQVDNPMSSVMEGAQSVWYNVEHPESLGLAAPVKRLLERLESFSMEKNE